MSLVLDLLVLPLPDHTILGLGKALPVNLNPLEEMWGIEVLVHPGILVMRDTNVESNHELTDQEVMLEVGMEYGRTIQFLNQLLSKHVNHEFNQWWYK